jgi:hypothetical protein
MAAAIFSAEACISSAAKRQLAHCIVLCLPTVAKGGFFLSKKSCPCLLAAQLPLLALPPPLLLVLPQLLVVLPQPRRRRRRRRRAR